MVLIFVVLIIIFIFVRSDERNKEVLRVEPTRYKDSLKTNAWLERDLFQKFFAEEQYTTTEELHEAIQRTHLKAQEEVTKRYFFPCIPLEAYQIKGKRHSSLSDVEICVANLNKCDSFYIRSRRERLNKRFGSCDDSMLYANFEPYEMTVCAREFDAEMKRCSTAYGLRHEIGDYITCAYGLYRVINITYNYNETKAYYVLEAIEQNNPFKKITIPATDETRSVDHRVLV